MIIPALKMAQNKGQSRSVPTSSPYQNSMTSTSNLEVGDQVIVAGMASTGRVDKIVNTLNGVRANIIVPSTNGSISVIDVDLKNLEKIVPESTTYGYTPN